MNNEDEILRVEIRKFEKWFRESVDSSGFKKYCKDFYAGQFADHIEEAFEYQQKKIDEHSIHLNKISKCMSRIMKEVETRSETLQDIRDLYYVIFPLSRLESRIGETK